MIPMNLIKNILWGIFKRCKSMLAKYRPFISQMGGYIKENVCFFKTTLTIKFDKFNIINLKYFIDLFQLNSCFKASTNYDFYLLQISPKYFY